MAKLTLVIASQNYSSWSLRPWIAMRAAEIPFEEIVIPLDQPDTASRIGEYSAAGLVPVLLDGDTTIWESLAILEYLAEKFPEKDLWPEGEVARATARAVSAEMHGGFNALRQQCPMNCRRTYETFELSPEVLRDADRVQSLWQDCRNRYGGSGAFLFGAFGNADAMFAPVVSRFLTYGFPLDDVAHAYVNAVTNHPAMQDWLKVAATEPQIDKYEL
jgi:glutathione S-transferase